MVAHAVDTHGRLDLAVNNAGIGAEVYPLIDTPDDYWDRVMAVNLRGNFLCLKHEARAMLAAVNGGSIVNISSIYGIVGSPHNVAYHASKGSVRLSTKAAALQYAAENIRVNSVHPGFVTSPMTQIMHDDSELARPRLAQTPLGRFGTPDDIANGCLFLASDESAWMTGAELVIDGGMTAG